MKTAVHLHVTTPQTNDYRKAGLQPAFHEPVISCRVHVWSNDFNACDLHGCLYDLIKYNYSTLRCPFGACGGAVGWSTKLQAGRSRVWFPIMSFEIFRWHNPSARTMDMESTQPLTETSTRNISCWGKGGRCVGQTTLETSCTNCVEIWEPQPSGTFRACPGLYRYCLPLQSPFCIL